MTLDINAVHDLVGSIVSRMAGDGTAIGDAIGLGVKKLRERPEGSRVLILVTDGENTEGSLPPRLAAQLAAHEGIRIYTIGVGSKGLVPFMEDGRLTEQKNGNRRGFVERGCEDDRRRLFPRHGYRCAGENL
jgi:Ca-activated chloride channel family protein